MYRNNPVYLDYAASTPVDPRVLNAMLPYFSDKFGNPSSIHNQGQVAEASVENARETIAECLNCVPGEIIFTSCGTESDNLALRGTALTRRNNLGTRHILVSPVEHHAVTHTARQLANEYNFELEILPVDEYGRVDPADLAARIRKDTAVVSIIYANNEIGTINPIPELAAVCRERDVPFHTDAVQAAAHLDINLKELGIDLLSIGAHKFYGPKGVGALYAREGLKLLPQQTGGGQENGRRAGTLNVPYIAGMAEALRLANSERHSRVPRMTVLRDRLIEGVLMGNQEVRLTGHPSERLPNHASFVFKNVDGNLLLTLLDSRGFACSSGSACKTGNPEPSDVLLALGLERTWALGSLRVTLGISTTEEIIDEFVEVLPQLVRKARK